MPKTKKAPKVEKSVIHSQNTHIKQLAEIAVDLRKDVIKMVLAAGSGHIAGPLGLAEIFSVLFFRYLNIDPKNPDKEDRDRFILSNGHTCPILYAALAHRGFFDISELKTYRKLGSKLQGHPHINIGLGIENSSGPLGQGLGYACGVSTGLKYSGTRSRVVCLTSDAELQEGATWEAAMYAGNKRLSNLTWLIDRNNIQIDGYTEDVMPLEPLREKLESFNWHVIEINGNDIEEIISALEMAGSIFERPVVIISHTIPGKGVGDMEYKFEWHGKVPTKEQAQKALHELRSMQGRIESEYE